VKTRAKICMSLILCAASFALAGEASAQAVGATRDATADALPPNEIVALMRTSGFAAVSRPVRSGRTYVLRALDPYDLELNLVVDARSGRLLSASEVAAPRSAARRGPTPGYDPYGAPVYGRIFGPPEDGFGSPRPPRNVPGMPSAASAPGLKPPQEKAAAHAPLPRPRPYVMEATGSVPAAADSGQKNPAPAKDDAKDSAQNRNGGASMPAIAPLD
jgi:hypothetical protein